MIVLLVLELLENVTLRFAGVAFRFFKNKLVAFALVFFSTNFSAGSAFNRPLIRSTQLFNRFTFAASAGFPVSPQSFDLSHVFPSFLANSPLGHWTRSGPPFG